MSDPSEASPPPLPVLLCGASGRMGQAVVSCARREPDRYRVVGELGRAQDPADSPDGAGVVVDFSSASGTESLLGACLARTLPVVIGTTGHSPAQRAAIHDAARSLPIVFTANFSIGVNTLFWLTREAARILGPDFDLEIVEMHHRAKKDSPSGTARRLAEILAESRGLDYADAARHGREGLVGPRGAAEIGMHAVRGGDVVGDHTVLFADAGERIELIHRATSRETFALGALRAAAWLRKQPPGLYDMEDVLGLNERSPSDAP